MRTIYDLAILGFPIGGSAGGHGRRNGHVMDVVMALLATTGVTAEALLIRRYP